MKRRISIKKIESLPGYPDLFGPHREIGLLIILTGLLGGLVGVAFLYLLSVLQSVISPGAWGSPQSHFFVLVGIGVLAGAIFHFFGNPGGVDVLLDNIHVRGGWQGLRDLRTLLPVSLLCISAGGALGPEAPLVQSNACVGSLLGIRRGLSRAHLRTLTIAGMATGFGVLFGAPLGAAIFSLEFLHREGLEYYEAVLPAAWGALCGYVAYIVCTGLNLSPIWSFPSAGEIGLIDVICGALAGLFSAVLARAFIYVATGLRQLFLRLSTFWRLSSGGVILGGLSFISPYALTFGELQINDIIANNSVATFFIAAAAAKFIGACFTLASGWRGGFIIPLFFIGCCMGRFFHTLVPGTNEVVLMTAMMAGLNAGVTKTPIGSTLVVTRMAHVYLLPTTLLSALIAMALSRPAGIIHGQRQRQKEE